MLHSEPLLLHSEALILRSEPLPPQGMSKLTTACSEPLPSHSLDVPTMTAY